MDKKYQLIACCPEKIRKLRNRSPMNCFVNSEYFPFYDFIFSFLNHRRRAVGKWKTRRGYRRFEFSKFVGFPSFWEFHKRLFHSSKPVVSREGQWSNHIFAVVFFYAACFQFAL